jgi:hypothetical protein
MSKKPLDSIDGVTPSVKTVSFRLDDKSYKIALNPVHLAAFEDGLREFLLQADSGEQLAGPIPKRDALTYETVGLRTIRFRISGDEYRIVLGVPNEKRLRAAFAFYIEHATSR